MIKQFLLVLALLIPAHAFAQEPTLIVLGHIVDIDPTTKALIRFVRIYKLQDGLNACYIFTDLLNEKAPPVVNCLKNLPATEVDHVQPKAVLPVLRESDSKKVWQGNNLFPMPNLQTLLRHRNPNPKGTKRCVE